MEKENRQEEAEGETKSRLPLLKDCSVGNLAATKMCPGLPWLGALAADCVPLPLVFVSQSCTLHTCKPAMPPYCTPSELSTTELRRADKQHQNRRLW